jgi:putative membrane protein
MYRALVLAAMTVALATSTVMAQQAPAPRRNPAAGAPAATGVNDSLFAMAASEGNMSELTLSQLGVEKATNAELKRFSQKMIQEHNRLNQELASLAGQRGIGLPRTLGVCAQFCAQALAGLSGEQFDRCYAKAQLHAHMGAVAAFEAESERGLDPQMRAFAARALPQIKEHLKEIKPIAMKLENEKEDSSPKASQR